MTFGFGGKASFGVRFAPEKGGFDASSLLIFAAFTTPPSAARKIVINSLVVSLKSAGIWAKLDCLYVLAAADVQAAAVNWREPASFAINAGGGLTFTADRGVAGDGTTGFCDSNFNPTTAPTPQFTQNSAHMGFWSRTNLNNAAATSYEIGNSNSYMARNGADSTIVGNPNNGGSKTIASGTPLPGHIAYSRTAAGAWKGYVNGTGANTGVDASAAPSNANLYINRVNGVGFGVNQIAAAHWGSQLNDAQALACYQALQAYMTAVGA